MTKKVMCCDDDISVDDINPLRQGDWLLETASDNLTIDQG